MQGIINIEDILKRSIREWILYSKKFVENIISKEKSLVIKDNFIVASKEWLLNVISSIISLKKQDNFLYDFFYIKEKPSGYIGNSDLLFNEIMGYLEKEHGEKTNVLGIIYYKNFSNKNLIRNFLSYEILTVGMKYYPLAILIKIKRWILEELRRPDLETVDLVKSMVEFGKCLSTWIIPNIFEYREGIEDEISEISNYVSKILGISRPIREMEIELRMKDFNLSMFMLLFYGTHVGRPLSVALSYVARLLDLDDENIFKNFLDKYSGIRLGKWYFRKAKYFHQVLEKLRNDITDIAERYRRGYIIL